MKYVGKMRKTHKYQRFDRPKLSCEQKEGNCDKSDFVVALWDEQFLLHFCSIKKRPGAEPGKSTTFYRQKLTP